MKPTLFFAITALSFVTIQVHAQVPASWFGTEAVKQAQQFDAQGPRAAGSGAEKKAADYIAEELAAYGYSPIVQSFTRTVDINGKNVEVKSQNVSAMKQGASPRTIIVGAHYDCATDGNGSDDNASGVALLLEICALVQGRNLPYTVRFVFFGAEEVGDAGSDFYVQAMSEAEIANTIAMLNYDSLIAGDKLYAHGNGGAKGAVRDWMLAKAKTMELPLIAQSGANKKYPAGTTGDWSDHAPFEAAGIQYAAFEATNWDLGDKDGYTQTQAKIGVKGEIWHTRFDTLAYIETVFPGRIKEHLGAFSRLLFAFLTEYSE